MMYARIIMFLIFTFHIINASEQEKDGILTGLKTGTLNWQIRKLVINTLMDTYKTPADAIRCGNSNSQLVRLEKSALYESVINNDDEMVKKLLPHCKNPQDKNDLLFAVKKASIAQLLFDDGCDPCVTNEDGETPLRILIRERTYFDPYLELMKTFVMYGMPCTPSLKSGFNEIEILLLEHRDLVLDKKILPGKLSSPQQALNALQEGIALKRNALREAIPCLSKFLKIIAEYDMGKVEHSAEELAAVYAKDDARKLEQKKHNEAYKKAQRKALSALFNED